MATSRDKQIGVALVVLAGLGAAVYFQQKKDAQVGTTAKAAADLPTIAGTEDLDKIVITNADKGVFELAKDGDKWWLNKPVHALANQSNVKQLIDNLKEIKATEVVATTATDDLKASYDLVPAKAVRVVGWKGAETKVDDTFGKSGSRGQMVMAEGKPGIYAAKGFSVYLYNREQKGWRDTEIFKFDDSSAANVTLQNKNGDFSFTKGDLWAGTFKGKPLEKFDSSKVSTLLTAYKNLMADDFADGKSPSETGLDQPEATVSISLKDGAGKYVLKVGKTSTGSARYAQKDGDSTIVTIASGAADWATADLAKFQKAPDAGAASSATASAKPPPGMPGRPGMPGMPPGHPPVGH